MGQLKPLFIAAQINQLQKRTPLQAALAFRKGQRKQVSQGEGRCSQDLREAEHPQLNVSLEGLETLGD